MRIMTSNIWGDFFGNEVSSREEKFYGVYQKYAPDIIGIQEATGSWYLSELFSKLEKDGYLFLGAHFIHPEMYQARAGEPLYEEAVYLPLLVKMDRFAVLSYGWEKYHDTPDQSKSVTWAILENKENHKVLGVCNTHFWWMERDKSDDMLRAENAKQLAELMQYLHAKHHCPVFAVGDMNARIDSEVFEVFREKGVQDLLYVAENASQGSSWHGDPIRGEDGKYHGKKAEEDSTRSIDHLVGYGDGYKVKNYQIIEDQEALDASDHSPVYIDVEIE